MTKARSNHSRGSVAGCGSRGRCQCRDRCLGRAPDRWADPEAGSARWQMPFASSGFDEAIG
jgi:hypothetical protein